MNVFDLQMDGKTFMIEITFANRDGYRYNVYERIKKAHWWSRNTRYLFTEYGLVEEDVKTTIGAEIKKYLSQEAAYNDFWDQVNKLKTAK